MNYQEELKNTPAPGNGCHPHLLRVANLGIRDGLSSEQVAADIRSSIPPGRRRVSDREIKLTVHKAEREAVDRKKLSPMAPRVSNGSPKINAKGLRDKIMAEGSPDEADLWEASPYRLDGPPEADAVLLLQHFYQPDEFLFMGDTYGKAVMPAGKWLEWIRENGTAKVPHIIPNPFDGKAHETSSGTWSRRSDAAVVSYRFTIVEFDTISRVDQLRFWSGVLRHNLLDVACLIDSGGKSLHAWVNVGVANRAAWEQKVKQQLFADWLIPLGVDSATKNPSRLSRLPGHYRTKTARWQRLIWLGAQTERRTS